MFGTKKKEAAKSAQGGSQPKADAPRAQAAASAPMSRDLSSILRHARITEKATMHSADGVYTFDIAESATKRDVVQAVMALYKVTPRMVHIVKVPKKTRRNPRTGKTGITRGGKKAYVYLKKGETTTIG